MSFPSCGVENPEGMKFCREYGPPSLRAMDPGDVEFQAKFAELREGVEQHVGMEEDELMPDTLAALGSELESLGRQLEQRKEQLMAGKS
jgi:hypothetical protein